MAYKYVPILRWKEGERDALVHLSSLGWVDTVPLIVLAPEQFVGKKQTKKKAAVPAPTQFANDAKSSLGNAQFMLDATQLPMSTGSSHPLYALAAAARLQGLSLVPCTTLSASPAYSAAVNHTVLADKMGVALRIDLQDMSAAPVWSTSWNYPISDTDLIVDLGGNVEMVAALRAALHPAFQGLHQGSLWRSVTIAGTSMPENFTGLAAGSYNINRTEFSLWQRLSKLSLPYQINFGDYATAAIVPPPTGIRWGYPINVKYSRPSDFVIFRGVRTKGAGAKDMDVQLVAHAKAICGLVGRAALPHCWGDTRIDAIAASVVKPGGLPGWVTISVNRHIEITRHTLP